MRTPSLFFAISVLALSHPLSRAAVPETIRFNEHVRPILSDHCFTCHGFDAKQRKADLRLDVAEGALGKRDGDAVIKPGDLAGSELWARVTSDDPETVMPPPSTKKKLTADQKEILRRWIQQGAAYQKHWAFEAPVKAAEPTDVDSQWVRQPIDRFIAARLKPEKLSPRPEADRTTLIRRVAFALTGLPPTIAEVDQFLADKSPRAYENIVDRYLQSKHFGEEMARHWLDVARYADTHGLHLDNERQMWAYRDWVVKAFNENLPFDQFTRWQLAGDMLPNATLDQQVATGFNRCNVTTSEGGSIAAEFQYRYAVDRAATTVQTWMGLTAGCAVCHDHKYDPLSMKEFYSLYAFFYSAADPAMDGNTTTTAPFLKVPTAEQQSQLAAAEKLEAEARKVLEAAARDTKYDEPADATPRAEPIAVADLIFDDFHPLGSTQKNTSRNAPEWTLDAEFGTPSGRRALHQANGYFHENGITLQLLPATIPAEGKFSCFVRLDERHAPAAIAVILSAGGTNKRVVWGDIDSFDQNRRDSVKSLPLPAAGQWVPLELSLVELGFKPGQSLNTFTLQISGGRAWWDAVAVSGKIAPADDPRASFRAWWKSLAGKSVSDVPGELQEILKAGPDKTNPPPTDEQRKKLLDFYLAYIARPTTESLTAARRAWDAAHTAKLAADEAIPGSFIFRDVAEPRQAHVMIRGQYQTPGEKVEPDVPAIFPKLEKSSPDVRATRLDLANWLVSPQHPLTARVAVNRLWQQFFGVGLVKTSYDFGSQGEPPSHPELLDWMAIHFRETGWDMKSFVRMLVTSATFRQEGTFTTELRQRDPDNRLYARGPRFRLDAEQIRDNSLFVSGLLNLRMGGRGAKSYQPPNIWEPVGYGDSNTRYYLRDDGDSLYRRSLYLFLKRTAPPPFMSNFDGPNREQPCSRRERSNTPLQALQLMNDVQHFEAARALAERVLESGVTTDKDRLTYLYRAVLAREPAANEHTLVGKFLESQRADFTSRSADAEKLVRYGDSIPKLKSPVAEVAAWTMVANLLLNLDETVTRN